jgi:hypothetical protein
MKLERPPVAAHMIALLALSAATEPKIVDIGGRAVARTESDLPDCTAEH